MKFSAIGGISATIFVATLASSYTLAESSGSEESSAIGQDSRRLTEEVLVTGIRSSLEQSLNIKRGAAGFVDAVSAEDIGKLPDQNVAESLQRVVGVAIQRDRGEGNFVSVRGLGPEFVATTLNGRLLTSGFNAEGDGGSDPNPTAGREFNFEILASEVVSGLEVNKSPQARLVEGGIGGTINVKTALPFELGNRVSTSVGYNHNDFADEGDPRASGVWSWISDDGAMGNAVSVAYSKRSIRSDEFQSFGYASIGTFAPIGTDVADASGGFDGVADYGANEIEYTFNADYALYLQDRERITVTDALQWRMGADTLFTLDALYSNFDNASENFTTLGAIIPFFTIGPTTTDPNHDLVSTVDSIVVGPNGTVEAVKTGGERIQAAQFDNRENETWQAGLNVEHSVGNWTVTGDLSYATTDTSSDRGTAGTASDSVRQDANGDGVPDNLFLGGTANTLSFVADYDATNLSKGVPSVIYNRDLLNEDIYINNNLGFSFGEGEDDIFNAALDAVLEVEDSFLAQIGSGVRFTSQKKQFSQGSANTPHCCPISFRRLVNVRSAMQPWPVDDFMHDTDAKVPRRMAVPDFDAFVALVDGAAAMGPGPDGTPQVLGVFSVADIRNPDPDPANTFQVEEDTLAAYVQLGFSDTVGSVPFSGNIGARLVHTRQTSDGFATSNLAYDGQVRGSVNAPVSIKNSYTEILPSLNVKFDLSEDLVLRFALAENLTRPTLSNLSPRFAVGGVVAAEDGTLTFFTATAGNPALKPVTSSQADLGLEWYFGEASALYGTVFAKKVDDFIEFTTDAEVIDGLDARVARPRNNIDFDLLGVEVGYQQAFTFLPEPFDGLGVVVNYTFIDSDASFTGDPDSAGSAVPGISDHSWNLALYYDKGPIRARVAYNYRSDFLRLRSDVFGPRVDEDYDQLDIQVGYDFARNITAFLEVINLTESHQEQTTGLSNRPRGAFFTGRRFGLGLRASF